jgi:outer membrane protein W
LQPWLGIGYIGGSAAVTNPTSRTNDNWMAAFDNETKSLWGTYFQVGLDIMFNDKFGLRGSYQEDSLETSKFSNLNYTSLKFNLRRYSIGIVSGF